MIKDDMVILSNGDLSYGRETLRLIDLDVDPMNPTRAIQIDGDTDMILTENFAGRCIFTTELLEPDAIDTLADWLHMKADEIRKSASS